MENSPEQDEPLARPHTQEWFAKIDVFYPQLGQLARSAIEIAGHDNVCSYCGDAACQDYTVHSKESYYNVRLCESCREARSFMYEEKFIQLNQPVKHLG